MSGQPPPRPYRLPLAKRSAHNNHARRWRVIAAHELSGVPVPSFPIPVDEVNMHRLPYPLRSRPGGRKIGTVERIWRMPRPGLDTEVVDVWAEGILDARQGMPWHHKRDVLWLDEIEATEVKLRNNAGRVFAEMGDLWTPRLAKALGTDDTNVGIGPIAADTTGRRPARTVVTDIVSDLRWIDRRVRFISVELADHGLVDAAAVPLDNAWVTERVARWGDQIEMLPVAYELPAPGRGFKNFASYLQARLDAIGARNPPSLGL